MTTIESISSPHRQRPNELYSTSSVAAGCCVPITHAGPVAGEASPATVQSLYPHPSSNEMVLVDNKKYACETCIKGHRSSSCKHTDRPLFEIKKKGRPVTQCEHCRDLRKTKQVHVKCMCEARDDSASPSPVPFPSSSQKKGKSKVPANAAFPNGLPEALGASVGLLSSSESDHDVSCSCSAGGVCNCCTPRKSAPRTRDKVAKVHSTRAGSSRIPASADQSNLSEHMQVQIKARIAELRPVLPKPTSAAMSGRSHTASSSRHPEPTHRHHLHGQSSFSPYGRAYEGASNYSSPPEILDQDFGITHGSGGTSDDDLRRLLQQVNTYGWSPPPNLIANTGEAVPFPSTCTCGSSCSCPGCLQHNASSQPSPSAFSHCTNPGACGACLDCTIMSFATSELPVPVPAQQQNESLEDWFPRTLADSSLNNPQGSFDTDTRFSGSLSQWESMATSLETFQVPSLTYATSNERPSSLSTDNLPSSPSLLSSATDSSLSATFTGDDLQMHSEASLSLPSQLIPRMQDSRPLSSPPSSAQSFSEGGAWSSESLYGGHSSPGSSTSLDQVQPSEHGGPLDNTSMRTTDYYR